MENSIKDIRQMTDSVEILEARPKPFLAWFAYIFLALLITAVVWAAVGQKEDTVSVNGVIMSKEDTVKVKTDIGGKITAANFKEGKQVKEGDVLFSIENSETNAQKKLKTDELSKNKTDLKNWNKFKKCVETGKNTFSAADPDESAFYFMVEQYLSGKKDATNTTDKDTLLDEAKITKKSLENNKNSEQTTINHLYLLKDSIEQEVNFLPADAQPHYYTCESSLSAIRSLRDAYDRARTTYEEGRTALHEGIITQSQLSQLENEMNSADMAINDTRNQTLVSIATEIAAAEKNIESFDSNLEITNAKISAYKKDTKDDSIKNLKESTLLQAEEKISALKTLISQGKTELSLLEESIDLGNVTAPCDGVIHVNSQIKTGDFIEAGRDILNVIPTNQSEYKCELYIPNQNVGSLKDGQKINYHVLSLPYEEYGEVTGKITSISSDAVVDPESGTSYYIAKATFPVTEMNSYKGETSEIKVGMQCEGKVVLKSKSFLKWILEQMDFLN